MQISKTEVDAALGLLKINSLRRRKSYYGMKVKKTLLQQSVLKAVYNITNFPSTETRNELALLLGISQRSVQVWFQNKRQICKKKDTSKNSSDRAFVNEYNKFVQKEINAEGNEEEVFDVPSTKLVEIINSCGLQIKNKSDEDEKSI